MQLLSRNLQLRVLLCQAAGDFDRSLRIRSSRVSAVQQHLVDVTEITERALAPAILVHLLVDDQRVDHRPRLREAHPVPQSLLAQDRQIIGRVHHHHGGPSLELGGQCTGQLSDRLGCRLPLSDGALGADAVNRRGLRRNLHSGIHQPLAGAYRVPVELHQRGGDDSGGPRVARSGFHIEADPTSGVPGFAVRLDLEERWCVHGINRSVRR